MRFLGGKWQNKNNRLGKGNRTSSLQPRVAVNQESRAREADFSTAPLANITSGFGRNDGSLVDREEARPVDVLVGKGRRAVGERDHSGFFAALRMTAETYNSKNHSNDNGNDGVETG
jgi:hypothetical protein